MMPFHDPAKRLAQRYDERLELACRADELGFEAQCDFDYLMSEQIIAGDVDHALNRLLEVTEETGEFGTLVMMAYDRDDKARWAHCLELFANELMPALNRSVGAVPAWRHRRRRKGPTREVSACELCS